jgi:hypothetical protein
MASAMDNENNSLRNDREAEKGWARKFVVKQSRGP